MTTGPFLFRFYINGELQPETITVGATTTIASIETACAVAATIAPRGPAGEVPVLVYRPAELETTAEERALHLGLGLGPERKTLLARALRDINRLVGEG